MGIFSKLFNKEQSPKVDQSQDIHEDMSETPRQEIMAGLEERRRILEDYTPKNEATRISNYPSSDS